MCPSGTRPRKMDSGSSMAVAKRCMPRMISRCATNSRRLERLVSEVSEVSDSPLHSIYARTRFAKIFVPFLGQGRRGEGSTGSLTSLTSLTTWRRTHKPIRGRTVSTGRRGAVDPVKRSSAPLKRPRVRCRTRAGGAGSHHAESAARLRRRAGGARSALMKPGKFVLTGALRLPSPKVTGRGRRRSGK